MSKCETCKWKNEEDGWAICDLCVNDPALEDRYKPFTNADHIRSLPDEELADIFSGMCRNNKSCDDCPVDGNYPGGTYDFAPWIKWLQQPYWAQDKNFADKNCGKTALKRKITTLRQELLNLERMLGDGKN